MRLAPVGASVEQTDDRLRKASEIADRSCNFHALHGASLIERYIHSDIQIAVRFGGVGPYKNGFLIKAAPVPEVVGGAVVRRERKPNSPWLPEDIQQPAVFSGDIQIMEGAKSGVAVRSWVWPQVFDDCLVDLGKPLYLFQNGVCGTAIGLLALRDQEVSLAFPDREVSATGRTPVAYSQSASQKVETTPYTVDNGADFRVDKRVDWLDIGEPIKLLSWLRIGIYSDGIGFIGAPCEQALLQCWELGYGPLDCSFSV